MAIEMKPDPLQPPIPGAKDYGITPPPAFDPLKPQAQSEDDKKKKKAEEDDADANEDAGLQIAGAKSNWQAYFKQHPDAPPNASPGDIVDIEIPATPPAAPARTEKLPPKVNPPRSSLRSEPPRAPTVHHKVDLSALPLGQAGNDEVIKRFAGPNATSQQLKNVKAYLDMIAFSEGTIGGANKGYNVKVGGGTFSGDQFPEGVVDLGHGLRSSASGRYQIMSKTWQAYHAKLGLTDFSPASQDAVALQLIKERGALQDVMNGRFDSATGRVRNIWASLPGAGYGQHENKIASLRQVYARAGGSLEGEATTELASNNLPQADLGGGARRRLNSGEVAPKAQQVASNKHVAPTRDASIIS